MLNQTWTWSIEFKISIDSPTEVLDGKSCQFNVQPNEERMALEEISFTIDLLCSHVG